MPTIEERVAYLEGRMQDHSALWTELRNGVNDLRTDMNRRFAEVRTEFDDVRVDLHRLDDKVDRHFVWLTGTLVTSVLVMMGAIVGLYFK